MAQGKAKASLLGIQGIVGHRTAPDWDFLYEVSSIKNSNYEIGDKVVTPDGRTFRYCKSHDACDTYKANVFYNAIPATGIDYAVLAEAASKGDKSVLLTSSAIAQTEDVLRGGTIIITENDSATNQIRGIIGNTACDAGGTCRIYLDAALTADVTTSWYGYCMPSPYSAVTKTSITAIEGGTGKGRVGFVGYAAAVVNAADLYHWEQTAGLISASLYGSAVGQTQYMREVVFRYDGNLIHRGSSGITGLEAQLAGYIVDNNALDNGATIIMLTGLEP